MALSAGRASKMDRVWLELMICGGGGESSNVTAHVRMNAYLGGRFFYLEKD